MGASTRRRWLLGVAGFVVALPAAWPQSGRVPTVTRLVKIFLDLESQLLMGDTAALQSLVADDFEMRVARRPGTPIPRAEWLAALAKQAAPDAVIEQMAAHDHGTVVVVSFMLRPAPAKGRHAAVPLFIVDTWAKDGDTWRLKVRYAAPLAPGEQRVPGEAETVVIPKKY